MICLHRQQRLGMKKKWGAGVLWRHGLHNPTAISLDCSPLLNSLTFFLKLVPLSYQLQAHSCFLWLCEGKSDCMTEVSAISGSITSFMQVNHSLRYGSMLPFPVLAFLRYTGACKLHKVQNSCLYLLHFRWCAWSCWSSCLSSCGSAKHFLLLAKLATHACAQSSLGCALLECSQKNPHSVLCTNRMSLFFPAAWLSVK